MTRSATIIPIIYLLYLFTLQYLSVIIKTVKTITFDLSIEDDHNRSEQRVALHNGNCCPDQGFLFLQTTVL